MGLFVAPAWFQISQDFGFAPEPLWLQQWPSKTMAPFGVSNRALGPSWAKMVTCINSISYGPSMYHPALRWALSQKLPTFSGLQLLIDYWITGETRGKRLFSAASQKKGLNRTRFPSANPEAAKKGTGQNLFLSNSPGQNTEMNGPEEVNPPRGSTGLKPRPGPTLHSKFAILVLRLEGLHQTDWYLGAVLSAKICISFVPQYICKEWGP